MKLVLIFCLMLGLSACVKISDADSAPSTTKAPEPVPVKGGAAPNQGTIVTHSAIQVQALPEPHRYQVHLPMHPEVQMIQRSMVSKPDSSKLLNMPTDGHELIDDQVESDQEYLYEQGLIQNGQFLVLRSDKVKIPKDLEIRSEVKLSGDDTWVISGRLFLYETGLIATNGFQLVIKVGKLIADSGTIRSFERGAKAEVGQAGKSGGQVRIQASTASGQLKVEMRGQNGGDGIKGADCKDFSKCPPAPIEYKTNGLAGFPGGNGMVGGNSGTFQISLSEAHQILVLPVSECGLGGMGGAGGAGSPGNIDFNMQEGPKGRDGISGPAGMIERSFIQDVSGQRLL